jgi:hypothetical protein
VCGNPAFSPAQGNALRSALKSARLLEILEEFEESGDVLETNDSDAVMSRSMVRHWSLFGHEADSDS